jgi:hypothetical protein
MFLDATPIPQFELTRAERAAHSIPDYTVMEERLSKASGSMSC